MPKCQMLNGREHFGASIIDVLALQVAFASNLLVPDADVLHEGGEPGPLAERFELVVPIATPVPRRDRVRTRWRGAAPSEQAS